MLGFNRPIRDRRRFDWSSGGLWQGCCGKWQTAGKSARYIGELVVPKPLDAVQRHLPF